ncbi:MAG: hypothetical protein JWO57_960 [Pseudonocardiales bacterium]|nr:hypothetical protein [Pseudonocardiales bacterium]
MPMPRTRSLRAVVATVLVVVGLILGALFRIVSGSEHHAYSVGAVPPAGAHVTVGNTYQLSVPGGTKALAKRGVRLDALQCEWSVDGSASQALTTATNASSKATNVVATFASPYTGNIRVDCTGWGAMYIDDADGAPGDPAGWFLVAAIIALTIGIGLGLAALRSAADSGRYSDESAGDDDEIERLVRAVHVRSQDREVGNGDGGDVLS